MFYTFTGVYHVLRRYNNYATELSHIWNYSSSSLTLFLLTLPIQKGGA